MRLYEDNENNEELPDTDNLIKNLKDFVRGNINRGELEDLYDDIGVRIRNPLGMSDIIIEYKNDTDFFENVRRPFQVHPKPCSKFIFGGEGGFDF